MAHLFYIQRYTEIFSVSFAQLLLIFLNFPQSPSIENFELKLEQGAIALNDS